VAYEGLTRALNPIFNDKLLAGLGKGVATTGRLNGEGVVRALKAGATWDEVREAAFMAALPAGIPAFEKACLTFNLLKKNKGMVAQDVSVVKAAQKSKAAKAGVKKLAPSKPATKKPSSSKSSKDK
jgi:exopolyphosphatase/guanosine-5'-triphosphate,3'-diphosphate pyrophosphatase